MSRPAVTTLRSTYRLQLTPEFGFDAARGVLPYLRELGVSHVYLSPCLMAVTDSTHGYDVTDPTRVDASRGGEAAFERLLGAAREHDLGVVLDIVPNHLAVSEENPWWCDVLARGRASRYAEYFDIDWNPPEPELTDRVLLPILGDELAVAVAAGHVHVVRTGDDPPALAVYDRRLPLAPESIEAGLLDGPLDAILDAQHYRLELWRTGIERVNWRRFFDVAELIGVRVEREAVFLDTHRRILEWVERGLVQGLRVDHPDGLRDPAGYLTRLRAAAPAAWIVVEKILEPEESLPAAWPVDGTTGYDFLNAASDLFVDDAGELPLSDLCEELTGSCPRFESLRREKQRLVVRELFVGESERLARLARAAFAEDVSTPALRRTLEGVLVEMPVYRTYVVEGRTADTRDRGFIDRACTRAIAHDTRIDPAILERLHAMLCGDESGGRAGAELRARFQQLTGPVMAKGLEDTAFYCDRRLVCLDEVGADPAVFTTTPSGFNAFCRRLHEHWPRTMTTLSTHDTKRSADVRLRIAALSEVPERWRQEVLAWRELATRHRRSATRPSRGAEYLLWQTLVGCWPCDPERVMTHMQKAAKEAKLRTSWLDPDVAYEEALERFVSAVLADDAVTERVTRFVRDLHPGVLVHSLALALLQMTAIGVPDVYQGCEAWRESLTDPDNRRPVDFDGLHERLRSVAEGTAEEIRDRDDAKLWLVHRVLCLLRDDPDAFGEAAEPAPLAVVGEHAERIVAFRRGERVAVVVPRLVVAGGMPRAAHVELPSGTWTDALHGAVVSGDPTAEELFARFPVALLRRH